MKVAITGSIGSGKTTACDYIRAKGYIVLDCDKINGEILNDRGYELLSNEFSECFIDKVLDKDKLADIVFCDVEKRKKLEGILHPEILKVIENSSDDPLFVEVPLLFEVNWDKYFDCNVLITCEENKAIDRLVLRGISRPEAIRRISAQMPVEEKIKKANIIIYNNGNPQNLATSIDKLLSNLL